VRAVYAISLVLGSAGLLTWIVMASIAGTVEGRESAHPERRFGEAGRALVAGLLGFGMAGMSASYGGWPAPLALVGALAGGAALALVARWLARPDAA